MIRRAKLYFIVGDILAGLAITPAFAANLGYAGRLVDASGAALVGPVDLKLRFFDAPMAGRQLGQEQNFLATELIHGVFQVQFDLDAGAQKDVFGDGQSPVYVEVEAFGKVYPRQSFVAVPLALRVPIDNATLKFSGEVGLAVDRVSISQVTGLEATLDVLAEKQAPIDATTTITAGGLITKQQTALLIQPFSNTAEQTGELRFEGQNSGSYIGFKAPASVTVTTIWKLPSQDGLNGQVLSTDGSGRLQWASPGGGGDLQANLNLADLQNTATARDNLGLGSLATMSEISGSLVSDGSLTNTDIGSSAQIATFKLAGPLTAISGHGLGALASLSTVSSSEIVNSSIIDADIASSAAVSTNKLSGSLFAVTGHGLGSLASRNEIGTSEITAGSITNAVVASDASIVTSKLAGALLNVSGHGLGTLATLNSVTSSEISDSTIMNTDISSTAAIATSKFAGSVFSISGHGLGELATRDGITTTEIIDYTIANADIASDAAISTSKLSGSIFAVSGHGFGALAVLSSVGSDEIDNGAIIDADVSESAAIVSTKISFANDALSGDKIDGGTISNFASTGIDDNANAVAVTINSSGNVGIGTTSPSSALTIVGAARNASAILNSTNTVNFATGNLQYTNTNCGTFNLNNLKDGGSYSFIVKGSISATCVFNAYTDAGTTALTMHLPLDHGATIADKHTMYVFLVVGSDVYASWNPGL